MIPHAVLPAVGPLDVLFSAIAPLLFMVALSFVADSTRHKISAIAVAGAAAAYLGGGLGAWEIVYMLLASFVAYRSLDSYRFVALAWAMHVVWDIVHHIYGNPIWPFRPASSAGCAITDSILVIWYLMGAPPLLRRGAPGTLGSR